MNDFCISCDFNRFLFTAHTHPLNGPFSETTRVSRYQKGKTNLDFTEARQWVAVASVGPYASLHLAPYRQPRQHPTTQLFTGRMPFLSPNQQRQSTEGIFIYCTIVLFSNSARAPQKCSINQLSKRPVVMNGWTNGHIMTVYTQGDSDVISFDIYASWFSPPPCG